MITAVRSELTRRYKAGWPRTLILPLLQFPIFLGVSSQLRDMLGMPSVNLWRMFRGSGNNSAETGELFVQSMTTGGPPWALDLTAADPTGALPFMVGGIMITQALISAPKYQKSDGMTSRVPTAIFVTISGLFPFVFLNAPAGILLYWASSSGIALLTNLYLNRRYPINLVKPCKRPVLDTWTPKINSNPYRVLRSHS